MVFQAARQFIARQLVKARPKPTVVLPGCTYYADFLTADEQAALEAVEVWH